MHFVLVNISANEKHALVQSSRYKGRSYLFALAVCLPGKDDPVNYRAGAY